MYFFLSLLTLVVTTNDQDLQNIVSEFDFLLCVRILLALCQTKLILLKNDSRQHVESDEISKNNIFSGTAAERYDSMYGNIKKLIASIWQRFLSEFF